ncbi:MAG: hypothetical protein Q8P61_03365, partial [Candidatus Nanopelagicales bacterium]|nr:hypothetical protein [Candidatus Nanopelagicales bacterium]
MAHLILHIGQHKTGTSALQRALRSAVDDLAEQGISYPLFLKAKNHARVPLMFAEAVRSTADPSGPLPRTPSIDQLAADLGHRVTGD